MNQSRIRPCRLTALLLTLLLMLAMSPAALADTDENTPRIAQQPDQLVLQLGVRWAGVEFELRTDAGRFPVPVVVDESGVLTMDLGGSTTYTLSCMESSVPLPGAGTRGRTAAGISAGNRRTIQSLRSPCPSGSRRLAAGGRHIGSAVLRKTPAAAHL